MWIVALPACFSNNYRKVVEEEEEEGAPAVSVYDFTPLPLPLTASNLQNIHHMSSGILISPLRHIS